MDFLNSITTAGFVEAAFWPGLILVVVLSAVMVRHGAEARWIWLPVSGYLLFYLVWIITNGVQTLAGLANKAIFMILIGAAMIAVGLLMQLGRAEFMRNSPSPLVRWKGFPVVSILMGVLILALVSRPVFRDILQPKVVLEGRAGNVRSIDSRMGKNYFVDIGGRTVNTTWPIYERLKLKPYVRVGVGRGSNYIYKIEYLAN